MGEIELLLNNNSIKLKELKHNSFHYLPIEQNTKVIVNPRQKIILGDPIALRNKSVKPKKKLVLSIFIDGLSSKLFDIISFENVMPNTSKYFESGTKFFNCFANSEWTFSSVPTLFSGLYTHNHNVWRRNDDVSIGEDYDIISEFFQNEGYLTTQICSNEVKGPTYNYVKGFDRTLYKRQMNCPDVIMKTLEHLRTFKDRSNYMWLSIFELHNFLGGIPDISSQSLNELSDHSYDIDKKKSVFLSYNQKQIRWYTNELKRLDFYIRILFDYIDEQYKDEDVVISIVSDHGQAFLGKQKEMLSEQKLTVPMMFKAKNINYGNRFEYIENVDYLPTLLTLSGIKKQNKNIDGDLPAIFGGKHTREYVFAESIFPNRKYEAVIYDNKYIFYCKSKYVIDSLKDLTKLMSGSIINIASECDYSIINRVDLSYINNLNKDLVNYYIDLIQRKHKKYK